MLLDRGRTEVARLPVVAVLGDVVAELAGGGCAVLVAPPGAGKTTLVPLALADAVTGRIVVAEPRRMAARAAARRMATLTGSRVGGLIGFSVRGERRVSPQTRVEVVTTGVLLRRLQRDPELAGTAVVMLDECHERHLDTDLALAFLVDVRGAIRPDLAVLAASATVDADRLARCLGGESVAPVIASDGALFPTEVVWCPPTAPIRPGYGGPVDPRLLDHVAATVRRALPETDADVLVFLPGVGEVNAVAGRLAGLRSDVDILALHGRQPARVQDQALSPGLRRRVVLATSVAESSLTVPGVRVVVDAGLAREPRYDQARGLGALVTVRVSRSAAAQRAGRAGREGPGRVYRCWSAAEHDRLAEHAQPEVAVADLAGFALELACWGHPDGTGLALPDRPPAAALRVARTTLEGLGAVDGDGRVTARGRAIAAVGAHPRLARALIDGAEVVGAERAAQVVAVLADGASAGPDAASAERSASAWPHAASAEKSASAGPHAASAEKSASAGPRDDLVAVWRRLRDGVDPPATARWRDEVRRLTPASPARSGATPTDDLAAGLVVGLAYPERIGRARAAGARTYLMTGGTAAELAPGSTLVGSAWLAIAVADRTPGAAAARIRLAAAIDEATAREAGAGLLVDAEEVAWHGGDVVARRMLRLGAIVLSEARLTSPSPDLVAAAIAEGLRTEGLGLLSWRPEAVALRDRLAFCHRALGDQWPAVDGDTLLRRLPEWLGPELTQARRRADLARIDVAAALRRLLGWREAARLDEVAPERLAVPSGSRIRVDYTDPGTPVLAVKLQEVFGWTAAPRIAGGAVTVALHLLSPAGRPAAVTSDLPSFWRNGYPQVRAELRGRYPRHAWPEDPTTAPPTRRPPPRRP